MSEFVLKTETERKLYVEALFICLDRGTLTENEVLEDLCDLIPDISDRRADDGACAEFIRQTQRILAGYRAGVQDLETATERLLHLFNHPVTKGIAPVAVLLHQAPHA